MYESGGKTPGSGGNHAGLLACILLVLCLLSGRVAAVTAPDGDVQTLVPVGHTVGIKLFSRGVLVVKLTDGRNPARESGLEAGDIILKCNGTLLQSTEQFQALIQACGGTALELQVRQAEGMELLSVTPRATEDGSYGIGAWIRDSMAGIGTVTFYDPDSGSFGALGHGITDTDTAVLMPFSSGSILPATVRAVKRGEAGSAGELKGDFDQSRDTGTLSANTCSGIFGTVLFPEALPVSGTALPVAENEQVHEGAASILANVRGDDVEEFQIEIEKILDAETPARNLLIRVTDPELLAVTGGIIQGMSGSPILQDGRLAGAVTHVMLHDPACGYGILIQNMLEEAEQ